MVSPVIHADSLGSQEHYGWRDIAGCCTNEM
jgi:hypothetical protein